MNTRDLGGHSGCKILLCEENDNRVFVRKISSCIEYNERLKIQADKQASYKSDTLKTPEIFVTGYTEDGLFFFDMEYIQGITMAEYMNTIEIWKVKGLAESIVKEVVSANSFDLIVDEDVFRDKVESLKQKLEREQNPIINESLDLLSSHSWARFTKTACHGDMTLENIIVKDGQLYLIDFLDSFYDCWIMDICTLLQDVQMLWSYRYQEEININTLIRLIVFRDTLIDAVKLISEQDIVEVYYALLLKLLRIYPYIKDDYTYEFLNEKTALVIDLINKGVKL